MTCIQPLLGTTTPLATTFVSAELEGEHRFKITCPEGHETVVGLRQPRFKILFESGALALMDGYFREAVATVAASLERFHEYWIRVVLIHQSINAEVFEKTWKLVASQSERQLGAFFFTYLQTLQKTATHLPQKLVEFRNDVIHKGAFPSATDTANFAEAVLKLIAPMNRELQTIAPKGVAALRTAQEHEIAAEGAHAATIVTIVGRATDMLPSPFVFRDELAQLDERRKGRGFAEVSA